jgi:hypothetical protein
MAELMKNPQHLMALGLVVVWLLVKFGPKVAGLLHSAYGRLRAEFLPKVKTQTNVFSSWPLIVLGLIYGLPAIMGPSGPAPEPVPVRVPDVLDVCQANARQLLAEKIGELAGKRFEATADQTEVQQAEDWMNESLMDIGEASYGPILQRIAKAKRDNRLMDLSEAVKKGEVRDE